MESLNTDEFADLIDGPITSATESDDFEALISGDESPLDRPIIVTVFPDAKAASKTEYKGPLRDFAGSELSWPVRSKASQRWLKLAAFGEVRSDKNSLRADANLISIDGIEADYDGGEIGLADAAARLLTAGVACILYTTGTHTDECPKWRVLCPTSTTLTPRERYGLVARLNGVLDGKLDGSASFTLSQGMRFGRVAGAPFGLEVIEGRAIDRCDHLDAGALDKEGTPFDSTRDGRPESPAPVEPFDAARVRHALSCIPIAEGNKDRRGYEFWIPLIMGIHHASGGSAEGRKVAEEWSQGGANYDKREFAATWRGLRRQRGKVRTIETVYHAAREFGWPELDVNTAFDEEPLPEAAVGEAEVRTPETPIQRMNRIHAVVTVNGRAIITTESAAGDIGFGNQTDLTLMHGNEFVSSKGRRVCIANWWLKHPERRSFTGGMQFAPGGAPPNVLNLWTRWATDADPTGSCRLLRDHILHVVCGGERAHADYVERWLAHMVQRPEEKPGVGLVLKGPKGAGKDTLADYVAAMIGRRHAPTVSQSDHIVGKFNARLANALLLHVQEGSWAGDRKAEDVLKYIVTSEYVEIERKGIDSINLPSVLRLFISANADWVVPASPDERRWAVFNVSDRRCGDAAYFNALRAEMNGQGPAALLHYLRTLDLTGFNVRKAPDTEGLRDQKLQTLRGFPAWWMDVLKRGDFDEGEGSALDWATKAIVVSRSDVRDAYLRWHRGYKYIGDPVNEAHFGRQLNKVLPTIETRRPHEGRARIYQYVLPSLPECRDAFARYIRAPIDWERDE